MNDDVTSMLRGRRVLVVEDDYLIAVDLQRLEAHGVLVIGPVDTVSDGQAALFLASYRSF